MALDFPTSPTDGQIYNNYVWNNTLGVWSLLSDTTVTALISNTPTGSYTDGYDYEYVSFLASGTLTVTRGGFADVLVVGGGGGGGNCGGGGGAGGHLYLENAYLPIGNHSIVVGAGGEGAASGDQYYAGKSGNTSYLGSLYFGVGGGAGSGLFRGSINPHSGYNGGSGGGAASPGSPGGGIGGLGIPAQGNDGGNGTADQYPGAGGGGAGAVGQDPVNANQAGAGGAGLANSITGSAVTRAGGGGGGCSSTASDSPGLGGIGGGGNGASNTTGGAGTTNTGGGGGGGGLQQAGGAGGSGIVIVRWRA